MGSLKVTLLLVATLLSSGPQALDLSSIQGSIFRRVLQSDYVAVGRITSWQRANMRPRPGEPVLDLKWIARGGWLYRFEIEELLCSWRDLEVQAAATGGNPPWPSSLSLFQTKKELLAFPAHQPTPPYEEYPRDDRFLLFATPREISNSCLQSTNWRRAKSTTVPQRGIGAWFRSPALNPREFGAFARQFTFPTHRRSWPVWSRLPRFRTRTCKSVPRKPWSFSEKG